MTEEWRPIKDSAGYEVSNLGSVRSARGKVLAAASNGQYGYRQLSLGRGNQRYVHRLVADAFIAPVIGMDVDHIDGDVTNNAASNLRVVTHAENMILQRERKPACKRGHLYSETGGWEKNGRRVCLECRRARDRARRPRQRRAA